MADLVLALGEPRSHFVYLTSRRRGVEEAALHLEPRPDGTLAAADHPIPAADFAGPTRGDQSIDLTEGLDEAEAAEVRSLEQRLLAPIEATATVADPEEYAQRFAEVFTAVDALEDRLEGSRFLLGGEAPGAADWFLYCVLLRFDAVYAPLYKLNRNRIGSMPQLGAYLRDLYQRDPAADVVDFDRIKRHYFWQDIEANHRRVIPRGGVPNLALPHDRDRFSKHDLRAVGTEEQDGPRPKGAFVRGISGHRHWITADGSSDFEPEPGRYHVYISNNCPWCHRVALTRALKGLEDVISMDVLFYRRDPDRGWQFRPEEPGCTAESLFGFSYVKEVYEREGSDEKSVPVLFDKKKRVIVSNESADIIRMIDRAFPSEAPSLCPPELEADIDAINAWTYTDINNGAYKAGFTHSQVAYDVAFERFFAALERLDHILAAQPFLVGDRLTEADVRLFPTIYRFDPVYYTRFRLNRAMVRDFRNLSAWHDRLAAMPAVQRASNLDHCKKGYFGRTGNNIVPLGPAAASPPL